MIKPNDTPACAAIKFKPKHFTNHTTNSIDFGVDYRVRLLEKIHSEQYDEIDKEILSSFVQQVEDKGKIVRYQSCGLKFAEKPTMSTLIGYRYQGKSWNPAKLEHLIALRSTLPQGKSFVASGSFVHVKDVKKTVVFDTSNDKKRLRLVECSQLESNPEYYFLMVRKLSS